MNKIPICDGVTLQVKDEKGRIYYLKYLIELDKQVRYLELTQREEESISALIKGIEESAPILPDGIDTSIDSYIRGLAWSQMQIERRKNTRKYLEDIDEYINIFVAGDNPALSMRLYEKFPVYRLIQENIGVLTGLTGDEIKN
jgi:hypothetical protein